MDPLGALASIIVGIYKTNKAQQWASLVFQMGFSGLVTFLFTAGSVMSASGSAARGVGSGMLAAACVLVYYFRRSPLTKNMLAVLPEQEAESEMQMSFQELTRK